MLCSRTWKLKYTPDDGDLVNLFYVPALEDAERYDRLTGYFNARALTLAVRGIEGLVRNGGRMRLVAGCTLEPPEIEAIEKGEQLRDLVERHLTSLPLAPPDQASADALELLAWMIARGYLDVKVAVPCRRQWEADPGGGHLPRESRRHCGPGRRQDRLERQPQRDRCRLATKLGEHQRLHEAGGRNPSGSRMKRQTSHAYGPTRRGA